MKALRIGLVALAACAMSACATLGTAVSVLGTVSPAVHTTSDKVVLEGTRALVLANNAYQAAANGIAPFVAAHAFTPAQVDRIEALSNRANDLLQKGDVGLTQAQRAAEVFAIADELAQLSKR